MAVKEERVLVPSSSVQGGTAGMVIPVGKSSERSDNPKEGESRGNVSLGTFELFILGRWISFAKLVTYGTSISNNATITSNTIQPVDTTAGAVEVILPSSAVKGDIVTLVDEKLNWGVSSVTLVAALIEGSADPKTLAVSGLIVKLIFVGGDVGWLTDLPVTALPTAIYKDSDWPIAPKKNTKNFISLSFPRDNDVNLPKNPNTGDEIELSTIDGKLFNEINIELVPSTGDLVHGSIDKYLIDFESSNLTIQYQGKTKGWVVKEDGLKGVRLFNKTVLQGNLNLLVIEGEYNLLGQYLSYTFLPKAVKGFNIIDASLSVVKSGSGIVQTLTLTKDSNLGDNPRQFFRHGKRNETSIKFIGEWVELATKPDVSTRLLVDPNDIAGGLTDGHFYIVNPLKGTPDHKTGDVYLLEVLSTNAPRPDFKQRFGTRILNVWNLTTRQLWVSTTDNIDEVQKWRKMDSNHLIELNDTDEVTYTPLSTLTEVCVISKGSQVINLDVGLTVESLKQTKVGDVIIIRNLSENVISTTITSTVSLVNQEGEVLPDEPHTMTGRGALKLIVSVNSVGGIFLRILIGVKS